MNMKLLFFLPIILFFGFFGLLILGFFVLIFKLIGKQKQSAWAGKLVDKKYFAKEVDDEGFRKTEHYYTLIFETDQGQKKLGVAKQVYDQWEIGDQAKKEKGKIFPTKIK